MSVIVSFPLMVYPLRASLHSLIFQQVSKNLSKKVNVKVSNTGVSRMGDAVAQELMVHLKRSE